MKSSLLAAALCPFLVLASQALAEPPAPGTSGIYATALCGEPASYLVLNKSYVIHYDNQGEKPLITLGPIEWQEGALTIARDETLPDSLPSFSLADYATACPALPGEAYVAFGEALTFFQSIDQMRDVCQNRPGGACAAKIFEALDVSEDRRLSPAEISRGLRALAFFVAYDVIVSKRADEPTAAVQVDFAVTTGDLFGASTLTSIASPLVTSSLLQSIDYDGDGFLSLKEILQDRGPLDGMTIEAGVEMESAQALLQNAVTMAPIVAGVLTKNLLGGGAR